MKTIPYREIDLQIGGAQTGHCAEVRHDEVGPAEVRPPQVRVAEVCPGEVRSREVRVAEVRAQYIGVFDSPLVPSGYPPPEDSELFFVGH